MSKLISIALVSSMVSGLFVSTAEAGRVGRRERHQSARIREGVRTGTLTRDEAKKLRGEEKQVREDRRAAHADGVVTQEERAKLREEQNAVSHDIYAEKHDGEVRQ